VERLVIKTFIIIMEKANTTSVEEHFVNIEEHFVNIEEHFVNIEEHFVKTLSEKERLALKIAQEMLKIQDIRLMNGFLKYDKLINGNR
jgi:nucleoside permease NupC